MRGNSETVNHGTMKLGYTQKLKIIELTVYKYMYTRLSHFKLYLQSQVKSQIQQFQSEFL